MDFWKADEPAEIAEQYMKFHPDLIGAHIAWIFREKASKSDGRPIIGRASRVPDRYKPLMEENSSGDKGYDFMIEIGADAWAELNRSQKEAWVDYLMEQCYGEENENTGEMRWRIRKPEVQAFSIILARHGTNWDQGVNKLSVIDLKPEVKPVVPSTRRQESVVEARTDVDISNT